MRYFRRKVRPCHNYVALIILFASILYLFNLGKRDFWAPDEPRYAQVSKEMWESKDFILPHLNGEKYPDKPPILFWLIILFSAPFGKITELSARLPSALSGIGCVVIIYYFAKQIFANKLPSNANAQEEGTQADKLSTTISPNPQRIGFLAALILATCIGFITVSRRVSFDGLLTLFLTLSLFCFYKGYLRKDGNGKFFLLSYLFMSVSTLTKGPVGFILPILIISTFLCVVRFKCRETRFRVRDMHIGLGVFIIFGIPLLWVYGLNLQGGWEHTKEVLFTQNIGRTVNSWSHKKPFYYFFIQFPLYFLPWSIFIPSVIIYYIKTVISVGRKSFPHHANGDEQSYKQRSPDSQSTPDNFNTVFILPAIWFIIVFAFFSIMSGKRSTYVLPLYPAASLFVAWFLDSFISSVSDNKFRKIGFLLPLKVTFGLLILMGILFPAWTYYYHHDNFISTLPLPITFICGIILASRYLFDSKPSQTLICSFLTFLMTVILGTYLVIPLLNEKKSARPFCENINNITGDNGRLAFLSFFRSAYLFYTERNKIEVITDMKKLNEFMGSEERVYLLLKSNHLGLLKKGVNREVHTILMDTIGHRTMILVSNK